MGVGRDPWHCLERARTEWARGGTYDWCCLVVDVDTHESLKDCLTGAQASGFHVAVTNPCFELWLLWHHTEWRRHTSASAIGRELRKWGHSGKSLPRAFPIESFQEAIDRALVADAHSGFNRIGKNPSSGMVDVVKLLMKSDV